MRHMTVKNSLLALCTGAAFLAPYAIPATAHAYNPVSGWSVKQAPFNDIGGEQSCTAMTQFDNGFTIQMTGTASGVKNLSIDVRQPAFQSGGIMDVNLEVPGVTAQQLQGQAYGNSLIVINMEGQKNLLAAMRSKNMLKMNVAGNDMDFNLNGLSDAAAHFDQCVGGNNTFGSEPVVTMAAAPAPVVEQVAVSAAPRRERPVAPVPINPDNLMSAADTPPAPAREYEAPRRTPGAIVANNGVSMPPEQLDRAIAEGGMVIATAAPASAIKTPVAPPPAATPAAAPAAGNLVARKAPPVIAPQDQMSAQDMERMEKRQIMGENFDPEAEFKTVPITEIAPPPPAMEMEGFETSESAMQEIPPAPAATPPAPVPVNPKRLSDQLAAAKAATASKSAPIAMAEKAEPVPVPQASMRAAPSAPPAPATSTAALDFAEPLANPPRSGRYKRLSEQLAAQSGTPMEAERKTGTTPPPARMAAATMTNTAAPVPAVEKADKLDTRTPQQKAADEAAWAAIPGENAPAAQPRSTNQTPNMITSSSSEKTQPPQKVEAQIIDHEDGSKEVRSPEARTTRRVEKVEMDMTKVGLPPEDARVPGQSAKADALEAEISRLRAQNEVLDEDLKTALEESKHEETSVSSENWNLEKASMRYNEAEKEIKRLAEQLRKERAQSAEEKKQLESMLFDPAVTDQKQIAKLADMEEQLRAAQTELANQRRTYEERLRAIEEQKSKTP